MSSFLTNIIFGFNPFPCMGWNWTQFDQSMHPYYYNLGQHKCRWKIDNIFDHIIEPMHMFIFNRSTPRISTTSQEAIGSIGEWYLEEDHTY